MNNKAANLAVIHNETHSASKIVNLSLYQRSNCGEPPKDLQHLIANFCHHIEKSVPHSAYCYRNAELGEVIKHGIPGKHSCTYSLDFEDHNLGELKLMRAYPFEDIELDLVEMLFGCLIFQLRTVLVSYQALNHGYRGASNNLSAFNGRVQG